METYDRATIERALSMTREAEYRLGEALDRLNSAENWGIADILGGRLITTFVKHARADGAEASIREARRLLGLVQRMMPQERLDAPESDGYGFARTADWLFDGLLADLCMQRRLSARKAAVEKLIGRVRLLRTRLERCL